MTAASARAVDAAPGSSPGTRPTVSALAVSIALHGAIAAAAVWWSFGATTTLPSAATVEVVVWAAPDEAVPAAAADVAPQTQLSAASAPAEVLPLVDEAPPRPSAIETAAAPPEPPAEPPPPMAEQAVTLFKPPPPKPKRREAAAHPASATLREIPKISEPPPQPVKKPTAETGTDTVTAAPPVAAPQAPTPAAPSQLASASEIAAAPPVITSARFRSPPAPPTYPRRAVDLYQEGEVIIRALVGPDGESRDVRVFRSSGVGLLDDAALRAVRRWAFEAAQINGRPVEAWVEVPVRFQLRSVL